MKLLLGATVALLLGALAVSWQGMNSGMKNASPDELARLKKQVEELRQQQDNLDLQRKLQDLKSLTPPTPTPAANAAKIEAMEAQVEQNKAALAKMEEEKAKREKQLAIDEEGLVARTNLESKDKDLRSARMIADALLIGRVKEYIEDAQFGNFITLDVLMKEQVQVGTILAIRRNNTGILGQFKVSEVTVEGAIANPLPGFGPVVPKVGDELILPPPF
jgi:hypothetical protein